MKVQYDSEVDALYISFKKGLTQVTTIRLSEDIAMDIGPGEQLAGIEILDASSHLDINRNKPEIHLENLEPV